MMKLAGPNIVEMTMKGIEAFSVLNFGVCVHSIRPFIPLS